MKNLIYILVAVGVLLVAAFSMSGCMGSSSEKAESGYLEAAEEVAAPPPPPPPPPSPPPPPNVRPRSHEITTYTASDPEADTDRSQAPSSPQVHQTPITPFEDVVSQLTTASFAYSWPDRVNIRERFDVSLAVDPRLTPEQVREALGGDVSAAGTVRVSKVLIARLTAPDFHIENITPERQALDRTERTQWRWRLKPKGAGRDKEIKITIIAVVTVGDESAERYVKTYDGMIEVDVTPRQRLEDWLADNWQWAWGALLIPAFLWWRNRRKRKGSKSDDAQAG